MLKLKEKYLFHRQGNAEITGREKKKQNKEWLQFRGNVQQSKSEKLNWIFMSLFLP